LAQLSYDKSREERELRLQYENGDILYYVDSFMNAPTYAYFASLEYAPDIYSQGEYGTRYFASDKLMIKFSRSDKGVYEYNKATNSYTEYDSNGKLKSFKQTYSSGQFKSIDTAGEKVVYADGSHFEGSFNVEVLEVAGNSLNLDERVKRFGIKLGAGPNHVTAIKPYSGRLYNSANKLVAIYRYGEKLSDSEFRQVLAEEEAERKAKVEAERQEKLLAQKIARLKKKYPAKFVNALANDTFMEDMPFQLFVDFYGASALEIDYSRCGHDGDIRLLCYVLNGTQDIYFMSSRLGILLVNWD
jgi:hypothetical protein